MIPTADQQTEIEDYIDRGWKTRDIIRVTGHGEALVREARRMRCLRRAHERADRSRAAAAEVNQYATPLGDLLATLRLHLPPLTSHDPGDRLHAVGRAA